MRARPLRGDVTIDNVHFAICNRAERSPIRTFLWPARCSLIVLTVKHKAQNFQTIAWYSMLRQTVDTTLRRRWFCIAHWFSSRVIEIELFVATRLWSLVALKNEIQGREKRSTTAFQIIYQTDQTPLSCKFSRYPDPSNSQIAWETFDCSNS